MQMQVYLTKPFFSLLFFFLFIIIILVWCTRGLWSFVLGFFVFLFCFLFFASRPVVEELNLVLSIQCTVSINGL